MKLNVSVNKAIQKGRYTVKLPAGLFFFLTTAIICTLSVYYLDQVWFVQIPMFIFGILLGIVSGWLYWSFAITKWRIWAFENVRNVHELKRKAVENNIIHNEGNWAEKTEIRNSEQKLKLELLNKKFLVEDIFHDDLTIPKETKINHTTESKLIMYSLILFFLLFPIYRFYSNNNYYELSIMLIGLFLYYIEKSQNAEKGPQILINTDGIKLFNKDFMSWQYITNESVKREFSYDSGKFVLYFKFKNEEQKLVINHLAINFEDLEHLLEVYRLRYQKKTNSQ